MSERAMTYEEWKEKEKLQEYGLDEKKKKQEKM